MAHRVRVRLGLGLGLGFVDIRVSVSVGVSVVYARGGFKEWPLGQWLTRPSRNEKGGPLVERILMKLFFIVKGVIIYCPFYGKDITIRYISA